MINRIKAWFQKQMNNNGIEEFMALKRDEAHDIKNKMTKDTLRTKLKVDKINRRTSKTLQKLGNDVTYRIAVAQGGRQRGLV